MKAAIFHGPKDIRISEIPKPTPGSGEVLVKVKASVICATDIKMYKGAHSYVDSNKQLIFGHENAGVIKEIGSGVEGYGINEPVFVAPNIGCGKCYYCINGNNNICRQVEQIGMSLNGGFAEYLIVPERAIQQGNLIEISPDISFPEAALTEPLACVLRGQKPLQITPEKLVLIFGGGPIGILHLKLAQLNGARKIILSEPNKIRRDQALVFGADLVVDPFNNDLQEIIMDESRGRGADVVITTAPVASAQKDAIDLAAIGGRICFFAGLPKDAPFLNLESNLIHYKELLVTGSSGNSTSNCSDALSIINGKKIDLSQMITGIYPLGEIKTAVEEAQKAHNLKIAMEPWR